MKSLEKFLILLLGKRIRLLMSWIIRLDNFKMNLIELNDNLIRILLWVIYIGLKSRSFWKGL